MLFNQWFAWSLRQTALIFKVMEIKDISDKDDLFEDGARLVVMHQTASVSLLQIKMKLGYHRAGRIMELLHDAGIVGQTSGTNPREVLIPDQYNLEQLLYPN